jgi:hypothetical protein
LDCDYTLSHLFFFSFLLSLFLLLNVLLPPVKSPFLNLPRTPLSLHQYAL